ncbi:MAG: hypothetical protein U9R19_16130, partial [Bacteroidota bacterium]|nr:hypothetical protein [Bacteroidota bacterium]
AAIATLALKALLNFLLFAFIFTAKINNYFNLASGLNIGEYYTFSPILLHFITPKFIAARYECPRTTILIILIFNKKNR